MVTVWHGSWPLYDFGHDHCMTQVMITVWFWSWSLFDLGRYFCMTWVMITMIWVMTTLELVMITMWFRSWSQYDLVMVTVWFWSLSLLFGSWSLLYLSHDYSMLWLKITLWFESQFYSLGHDQWKTWIMTRYNIDNEHNTTWIMDTVLFWLWTLYCMGHAQQLIYSLKNSQKSVTHSRK